MWGRRLYEKARQCLVVMEVHSGRGKTRTVRDSERTHMKPPVPITCTNVTRVPSKSNSNGRSENRLLSIDPSAQTGHPALAGGPLLYPLSYRRPPPRAESRRTAPARRQNPRTGNERTPGKSK